LSLRGNFFTKNFEILAIFSYLSTHFYAHNVKTNGLRIPSTTENFVKVAQGACRYCIAPRRWCILLSS